MRINGVAGITGIVLIVCGVALLFTGGLGRSTGRATPWIASAAIILGVGLTFRLRPKA
jgi:hypothetical protein